MKNGQPKESLSDFTKALPIIANALGDSFGVKVVTGPVAETNGSVIYLPPLDSENPRSRALGLGRLVHEASRVRFSDFSLSIQKGIEHHVWHILEGVRIEKAMIGEFPGTALMLEKCMETLIEIDFFKNPQGDSNEVEIVLSYMLYALRRNVVKQVCFTEYANIATQNAEESLPKGMLTRLNVLMYQVEQCNSSSDVLDLTRAILKMIEDEAEKEEQRAKDEQAQQDSHAEQSQGSSGSASSSGSDQANGKDDSAQNGAGASQQQGGADPSQKTGSNADGKTGDAPGKAGATSSQESEGSTTSGGAQPGAEAETNAATLRKILGAGDGAWEDVGKGLEKLIGEQADQDRGSPSTIVPFRPRVVVPLENGDGSSVKMRTAGATRALRRKMQIMLQARDTSITRTQQIGTKIRSSAVHRAPLMGSIFAKKSKQQHSVNTAVALLGDISDSMDGDEELVMDAMFATMHAFQGPKVATAGYTFPFQGDRGSMGVMKKWNEQPAATILRGMNVKANGTTPLAEAMFCVLAELSQRREERKILFVETDGDPNCRSTALWVIQTARAQGIEVLGLGIGCDVSKLFGEEFSTKISGIDELPIAMIEMLSRFV